MSDSDAAGAALAEAASADADPQQDTHQTAIAALLFMLSRYRRVPCARTRAAIVDHLARVAGDVRSTSTVRQAALMLHREWSAEWSADRAAALQHRAGPGQAQAQGTAQPSAPSSGHSSAPSSTHSSPLSSANPLARSPAHALDGEAGAALPMPVPRYRLH